MAQRAKMLVVEGQAERFRWPADWTPIHPEANRYPLMDDDKYRALKASIAKLGQLDPILLDVDGRIVSGRNRERACRELSLKPRYEKTDLGAKDVVNARDAMRRTQTASMDVAVIMLGYGKLTQVEIAERAGCKQPQVSRVIAGAEAAVEMGQATSMTDAYTQIAYGQITEGALRQMKRQAVKERQVASADKLRAEQNERAHKRFRTALEKCPEESREDALTLLHTVLTIQAANGIDVHEVERWLDWEAVEDED